jgi:hypothetical protein
MFNQTNRVGELFEKTKRKLNLPDTGEGNRVFKCCVSGDTVR